jgi:hypothetical protein
MTSPTRFDMAAVFLLMIGIVLVTVGMYVGLGRIGDALVANNPDAGTLFNPQSVSRTLAEAGFCIGLFVSVGSAFVGIAVRRWK